MLLRRCAVGPHATLISASHETEEAQLKKGYVAILASLAILGMALPAAFASGSTSSTKTRPGHLSVGVSVLHFTAAGKTLTANGLVTGTLVDGAGHSSTIRQKVRLSASTGGG